MIKLRNSVVLSFRLCIGYACSGTCNKVRVGTNVLIDLPYIYSTEGKVKEPNLAAEAGQGLLSAVTSYARGDMVRVSHTIALPSPLSLHIFRGLCSPLCRASSRLLLAAERAPIRRRGPPRLAPRTWYVHKCDIGVALSYDYGLQISFSGCKDSQTSADTVEAGQSTGAMSFVSSEITCINHHES